MFNLGLLLNNSGEAEQSVFSIRVILFCVVCAAIGFTLNLFPFELYRGLTLILGPSLSLLVAMSVSPIIGAIVAAFVTSALFMSWQHSWGFLLFIPEAYIVGHLFRKGWNELLAVTCYWVIIAIPFVVTLYIFDYSWLAIDVSLKYISNAFVYTLIASALIWFFSIPKRLSLDSAKSYSLRTQIFMILMISMALPITIILLYATSQQMKTFKHRVEYRLNLQAERIKNKVENHIKENQIFIRKHAELLGFQPQEERYSNLRLREFQKSHTDFLSVFVTNNEGNIEAFSPLERLLKERPSIEDREYFKAAMAGKGFVSEVIRSRAKDSVPIIVISQPVIEHKSNEVVGIIAGSLNLSILQEQLSAAKNNRGRGFRNHMSFLVTDANDKVIFASAALNFETMQSLLWGEIPSDRNEGFYSNSYVNDDFMSGHTILANGWNVRTLYFSKHFNRSARAEYHRLWIILIAAILIIGVLAAFISNQINGSLLWLLKRANSLNLAVPSSSSPIELSPHIPREVRQLVRAFESAERRVQIAFETEKMHQSKRMDAEKASNEKTFFVSSMSHELRTPLNAILGFCQLLKAEENLPEEAKSLTNEIYIASQHLMLLVNDILDLSKIESGKLQLNIETTDLGELIRDSVSMLAMQAQARDIEINSICSANRTAANLVLADKLKLKQILLNLLSNAIKYNLVGGMVEIDIAGSELDSHLLVSITDNGRGIPEEKIKLLFLPFERLSQEGSDIDGYGIGLTVSKKLIEAMNGQLTVESKEGEGSKFTFSIPSVGASDLQDDDEKNTSSKEIAPCRILYVEDNQINALVMEKAISRFPQVDYCHEFTGRSGIARLEKENFDFVFLDISLPDMSGFEILKQLKSQLSSQYQFVFAVSANALSEDIQRGIDAGFDEYITKPVKFDLLFEKMKVRQ